MKGLSLTASERRVPVSGRYRLDEATGYIDYDKLEENAMLFRPPPELRQEATDGTWKAAEGRRRQKKAEEGSRVEGSERQ